MEREEAIRRIKAWNLDPDDMEVLATAIPELKENEDERIRMALIKLMTVAGENYVRSATGFEKEQLIAYLEKQQERNVVPSRETILGIWELGNFWKEDPEEREGLTQLQYIQKYWNEKCDYQKEQKPINNSTREKIISRATSEKQVVLLSESNGNAEIGWDTRSLEDAKKLLEYGIAFINEQLGTKPAECGDDENIRKGLIQHLKELRNWKAGTMSPIKVPAHYDAWITYLEKQQGQKSGATINGEPITTENQSVNIPLAEWNEDYDEDKLQTRFAFYTYKDEPSVLYLSNVFVEKACRTSGYGTRILKAAEKVAEVVGATTIRLKVKQESLANAWYRKNGYSFMTFEDGYNWLEKNIECMKPNKQEWSKEDKVMLNKIEYRLKDWDSIKEQQGYHQDDCTLPSPIKWLESLPERFNLKAK